MKNEVSMTVLAVCRDEDLYDKFRAASPEATECLRAESAEQAVHAFGERSPDLVVIEHGLPGEAEALVRRLRQSRVSESSQYLVVAGSAASAEIALLAGFDAAILGSTSVEEVRLAIRAAFLRRKRCATLVAERNFLGAAVRREENLSRQLLDHHVALEESLRGPGGDRADGDSESVFQAS
jgi:DNA-binding response OmpR family regulator